LGEDQIDQDQSADDQHQHHVEHRHRARRIDTIGRTR
jgi:hypothetical protein